MFSNIKTINFNGLDENVVEVETSIRKGMLGFYIIGLVDKTVLESRHRIKSSFSFYNIKFPYGKVVVNISPANIKKIGTEFDLPISISILSLIKNIKIPKNTIFIGELSLNGKLIPLKNPYKYILSAIKNNFTNIILSKGEYPFIEKFTDINIYQFDNLYDLINSLENNLPIQEINSQYIISKEKFLNITINDIIGQERLIRAIIISLSGKHHLLINGPVGSGKTRSVISIKSILPDLDFKKNINLSMILKELYDLSKIRLKPLIYTPNINDNKNKIFGGKKLGEINSGSYGIIHFNELNLFSKKILNKLREIMDNEISKISNDLPFLKDYVVIATTNPCPCGNYGSKTEKCTCSTAEISRYKNKLNNSILDRFQIKLNINKVENYSEKSEQYDLKSIKKNIHNCWKIQSERYNDINLNNGNVDILTLKNFLNISLEDFELISKLSKKYNISKRGFDNILRIILTICDYEKSYDVKKEYIFEAINYVRV